MTVLMLKLIAIFTMLIDHTGAIIYTDNLNLRIIGRLAFPIFAFLIAEGYVHTRSFGKYMFRMFIFAMISQIPFYIALAVPGTTFSISMKDLLTYFRYDFNVMFTFVFALFAIWCYEFIDRYFSSSEYKEKCYASINKVFSANKFKKNKSKEISDFIILTLRIIAPILVIFSLCLLAAALNTDYAYYGVLLVFVFYFFKKKGQKILGFIIVQLIYTVQAFNVVFFMNGGLHINPAYTGRWDYILLMIAPLVSAIFIYFYNGELGTKKLKWFFYVFYPVHILILYLIKIFFFS